MSRGKEEAKKAVPTLPSLGSVLGGHATVALAARDNQLRCPSGHDTTTVQPLCSMKNLVVFIFAIRICSNNKKNVYTVQNGSVGPKCRGWLFSCLRVFIIDASCLYMCGELEADGQKASIRTSKGHLRRNSACGSTTVRNCKQRRIILYNTGVAYSLHKRRATRGSLTTTVVSDGTLYR